MVVREGAALERYRCLNPVIHAMPQIFSLSFTVSPRHCAARSRIARRVSSCSLALPQVNLFAWRVFEPKAAAGVSEPGALSTSYVTKPLEDHVSPRCPCTWGAHATVFVRCREWQGGQRHGNL